MALVIEGEERIRAPVQKVWEALNDPEMLRACIPGCETLDKNSDTELAATVVLKIGPIKAKFAGEVTLSNLNPPTSYTISGEGEAQGQAIQMTGSGTATSDRFVTAAGA